MNSHHKIRGTIIEIICLLYVLLFIYAAVSKMLDYENFQIQLGQSPLLSAFASWVAPGVLFLELATACFLMVPRFRSGALLSALALMSLFTVYIFIVLHYSSFVPCSCGGILEKMSWNTHLIFNILFVMLAIAAIVLQYKLVNKNRTEKSQRAILISIVSTILFSTVVIIILFLSSEKIMHYENPFIRRYPQHPAMFEKQLDLKFNSYYFAGQSGGKIYLGNYTAPLKLKSTDANLRDVKSHTIIFKPVNIPFQRPVVSVLGSHFYLKDGMVPAIFRGNTANWRINHEAKGIPYFTQAVQMDSITTALRSNNGNNLAHILGIFKEDHKPKIQYNRALLKRQIDGVFDTDGMLLYSEKLQKQVYIYFYRNEYIIAGKDGQLIGRSHTIDTVSKAKIKVAYLNGNTQRKMSAPPLIVNANAAVCGNLLFINSKIKGKFEDEKLWEQASIIDVYDITKNAYLMSFPIYHIGDHKLGGLLVTEDTLYALIGSQLAVYKFRAILKKEFKNEGFKKD